MENMVEKAKTYSFSAAGKDKVWLEGFKERLGKDSFSQAVLDGLKTLEGGMEISKTEREFNEYCRRNFLNKDAQLALLMGPYRVCNNGMDD